jgi:Cu(I)/Ag(I) efflux system membrane fusion protein
MKLLIMLLNTAVFFTLGFIGIPYASSEQEREILYWVAPMDANFIKDEPGKSPMGMDLVPVYVDEQQGSGSEVVISPEVIQNLGVRTSVAERSKLWRKISTVGFVEYDESKMSHIHLRTQGWIEKLKVHSEGERVEKGDFLFSLYSPELVNAQEELLQALKLGNSSLVNASKDRLVALGMSRSEVKRLKENRKLRQNISYYAPQDGVVSNLMVREGMFVKPENQIATLADLSTVWVMAEVFERQSSWVKVGHPAEVEFSYLPGKKFKGVVEYVYPDLDEMTRALTVRLKFDNFDESLKPNMFGDVSIYAGAKNNIVVIPREAIIRTGSDERVILAKGDGRFEPREVVVGMESGDWIEVQSGLEAGEEVVISGQFLIDSEASTKASFMRMRITGKLDDQENGMSMSEDAGIVGMGTITQIYKDEKILKIDHQPIEVLDWPRMEMKLSIDEDSKKIDFNALQIGDHIQFEMKKINGKYLITTVILMNKKGGR